AGADRGLDSPSQVPAPSLDEQLAAARRLHEIKRSEGKRSVVTDDGQQGFEIIDENTSKLTYGDKTVAKVWEKDGVVKATYPDGVEVTKSPDVKLTTRPDGGEIQEFKDGTVVIKTKDGIEAEKDSNGCMKLTDSNGHSISVDPDGNCVPPETESGFKVERSADGTVITGKDGSAVMFSPDGAIAVGKGESQTFLVAKEFVSYKPGKSWDEGPGRDLEEKIGSPTGTKDGPYHSR